jgi:hypothetical protein
MLSVLNTLKLGIGPLHLSILLCTLCIVF